MRDSREGLQLDRRAINQQGHASLAALLASIGTKLLPAAGFSAFRHRGEGGDWLSSPGGADKARKLNFHRRASILRLCTDVLLPRTSNLRQECLTSLVVVRDIVIACSSLSVKVKGQKNTEREREGGRGGAKVIATADISIMRYT